MEKLRSAVDSAKLKAMWSLETMSSPLGALPDGDRAPARGSSSRVRRGCVVEFTGPKLGLTLQRGLLSGKAEVAEVEPGGAADLGGVAVRDIVRGAPLGCTGSPRWGARAALQSTTL